MRIIILGIDGLEYNLVEEWDLKYLKQEAYCKTDLSDFDVIVTPPIWGAMITGKIEKEVIKAFQKRKNKEKSIIWNIGKKILPKSIKRFYWKNIWKLNNPFDKTSDYILRKGYTTIFDFFEKSWHNGLPGLGRNVSPPEARLMTLQSISNPQKLVKFSKEEYEKDKQKLLNALEQDYELIFWYTPFLDRLGHRLLHKKLNMMNFYFEVNRLVGEVKKKEKNASIYIISDHGMELDKETKRGMHSNYGYFSSNTGESIKKPMDLFFLIKEKAKK